MNIIEWLRVFVIGIVEGITEWLPVSSTGHMILLDNLWPSKATKVFTPAFQEMFLVVIQLGAILAVCTLFFHKLNPFSPKKSPEKQRATWILWGKVIVGCLPAAIIGIPLDDWMDAHLYTPPVIAFTLVLYGVLFLLVEYFKRGEEPRKHSYRDLTWPVVLGIGFAQVLSLVPGTSRSGVTILAGLILGTGRVLAAEYTFFLAIPVMFGASLLKILKFFVKGGGFTFTQFFVLIFGMAVAYIVSVLSIRFLMSYVKRHSFSVFGIYRILLGIAVIITFFCIY